MSVPEDMVLAWANVHEMRPAGRMPTWKTRWRHPDGGCWSPRPPGFRS